MQIKGNNAASKSIRAGEATGIYSGASRGTRSPFWLPAASYYGLSAAGAGMVFVLMFTLLQDNGNEYAVFWACSISVAAISFAVLLREIILRGARERLATARRRLDANMRGAVGINGGSAAKSGKFTLEKNDELLQKIREKSDAAKVFGGLAEGHKEVFEMCEKYLAAVRRELPNVGVGSPRIAAFRRGTKLAATAHRFHLLKWAELEARSLTIKAREIEQIEEKIAVSQEALDVVRLALKHYPNEVKLLDSAAALREHLEGLQTADLIEQAEKAVIGGNKKRAAALYQNALKILSDDGNQTAEKLDAIKRITGEVEKLTTDEHDQDGF